MKEFIMTTIKGKGALIEFMVKVAFVTFCIHIVVKDFRPRYDGPRYEFLDATHRCNIVTGVSEEYSRTYPGMGWHE